MPHYMMKADKEHDLYVEWSTIVDAPVKWGTWEEMAADPETRPHYFRERKDWIDEHGTSVQGRIGSYPFEGSWEDSVLIANMGDLRFYTLQRDRLYDFLVELSQVQPPTPRSEQTALDKYATPHEYED